MRPIALGLMSGTSADGITAAAAEFSEKKYRLLGFQNESIPPEITALIRKGAALTAAELSPLNFALGELFAQSANKLIRHLGLNRKKIACIGSHGQTIYHGPNDKHPNTLQIGEPAVIAERTGISVVSNFRERDISAGGEGAPLIPFFDRFFFGQGPAKALQNIGGIANVTVVGYQGNTNSPPFPSPLKRRGEGTDLKYPPPPCLLSGGGRGRKFSSPLAFDTGPGNSLMDEAVRIISNGEESFDKDGRWAARGMVDLKIIQAMMNDFYFSRTPPKSTGLEKFGRSFLLKHCGRNLKRNPKNTLATLCFFTALSIYEAYRLFIFPKQRLSEIIISGGGAKNKTLMWFLTNLFEPLPVVSIEEYGIPVQAKEPLAFAFFALRALERKVNHWPQTTGARGARILGRISPP